MVYLDDQIRYEEYMPFQYWLSYRFVIAASVETLQNPFLPAPCLSDAIFLGRDLLICDSCHEYRMFRELYIEIALRRQALPIRIYVRVSSGVRWGLMPSQNQCDT